MSPSDNKIEYADKLLVLQRQLVVIVLSLVLLIMACQICSYFADILRVLGVSILFSYLFIAVVDWLNKFLKMRILAVLIVYALVLIGIVFSAITLVPTVISQVSQLINSIYLQLPQIVQKPYASIGSFGTAPFCNSY